MAVSVVLVLGTEQNRDNVVGRAILRGIYSESNVGVTLLSVSKT